MIILAEKSLLSDLYAINLESDGYFERCLQEQEAGKRKLYIFYNEEQPAGYVQLIFNPVYIPFKKMGIYEIQDLFVASAKRKLGIGNNLVAYCEDESIKQGLEAIGIGVALYRDYGSAQRLYAKRGYIPDGAGIVYDNQPVIAGQMRAIDDYLCLKMIKNLK